MMQGSTEHGTAREKAINQLDVLAKTSTLHEIRAAASYMVSNISERTTTHMLSLFEAQISNLLIAHPRHQDTLFFHNTLRTLHLELPLTVAPILPTYTRMTSVDESIDESDNLRDEPIQTDNNDSKRKKKGYIRL